MVRGIEGIEERNGVNEGKDEWCLWRVDCVGEVYGWRTRVTKTECRQQDDADEEVDENKRYRTTCLNHCNGSQRTVVVLCILPPSWLLQKL